MSRSIQAHHQRAIDRVVARFSCDPAVLAILVCGSVAKETARADSDVDVMLVVTVAEYARREAIGDLAFCDREICDYEGGYVDCKIIDLAFMRDAGEFGSEPSRNAFISAYTVYGRESEVETLLAKIPVYPEALRQDHIDSFMSQVMLDRWFFFKEAQTRNDPYLLHRTAANIVLFAGRLILAHNRILFPCHKRLMEFVEAAPEKPNEFCELARQFLNNPTEAGKEKLCELITKWRDWGVKCNGVSRHIADTETTWRTRVPAVTDW